MKTKTILIALILGLVAFWGCDDNGTDSDNDSQYTIEKYYPLAVGNVWNYEYNEGDETSLMEITGKENSNTFTGLIDKWDENYNCTICRNNNEIKVTYSTMEDYSIPLKEPLEVGQSWVGYYEGPNYPEAYVRIQNINVNVTVPAGSFSNCLEIVTLNEDGTIDDDGWFYYAPNVGLVKEGYDTNPDGSGGDWLELVSYTIN